MLKNIHYNKSCKSSPNFNQQLNNLFQFTFPAVYSQAELKSIYNAVANNLPIRVFSKQASGDTILVSYVDCTKLV
mgnify:CR=1 FL=1